MTNGRRDYKKQYAKYDGRPDQIKARSQRNSARAMVEKRTGNLPTTTDVDHKTPISKGGRNTMSNLRPTSRNQNRSFARNPNGSMKSQRSKSGR
jgi:5-methylcytosine-specific restriction endonuclease McrA